MLHLARRLLVLIASLIFWLRYRVKVTGLQEVRGLSKALILPNHPAYMDPPLVLRTLWPVLRPRPMLLASVFHNPLVFWLPRVLDAVEIPELGQASAEARAQTEASLKIVTNGLKAGRNHILWPAGRVYSGGGRENLWAARSLSQILEAVPDAQIIAVRTRGLWGSMFSFARTGRQPNQALCLLKGAGILLANLVFLAPRRQVHIHVERIPRERLPGLAR
jgi:long-chain-fatty-acid--[acyl-carrier-protein] ligase